MERLPETNRMAVRCLMAWRIIVIILTLKAITASIIGLIIRPELHQLWVPLLTTSFGYLAPSPWAGLKVSS